MADFTVSDIALLRNAPDGESGEQAAGTTATRAPQRRKSKPSSKEPQRRKPPVDSDERIRHVTGILLGLGAVLLLLALVSYTPLDQANADVGVRDLTGLLTHDPTIAAKADTTENWLGLIGAFISNFLINSTIGYVMLILPALMGIWALTIFNGTNYTARVRLTLYSLLVATLVSAIFGTIQLVSWMPHPAQEWSGAVGAFIASILSGLLGTAGSFLILTSAIFLSVVYAFDLNMKIVMARAKEFYAEAAARAQTTKESLATRLGEANSDSTQPAAPRAVATPAAATTRDEPARMTRRMRDEDDLPCVARSTAPAIDEPVAEPRIRRTPPPPPAKEELRPPVTRAERPAPASEPKSPLKDYFDETLYGSAPATADAAPDAEIPLPTEEFPSATENVEIMRGEPAPVPVHAPAPKLTLNVQEADTEEDHETDDDGELIDELRDEQISYIPPSIELLIPQSEQEDVNDDELKENARILQEKLGTFNIKIENLTVTPGPVVTLYEFVPAAGIKISQIESLTDDIALAMKARGIRIIAPIPGKGTVGVEIPNHKPTMVRIRSVLNTPKFRESNFRLSLALGKTTVGEVFCDDLAKMPHLLIAGATGSGKSVGVNSILASLIYRMHPSDLKFVIVDPKKIELSLYRSLRDHFLARCPDIDEEIITNPQNAVIALKSLEMEMDRRYDILAKVGQRNIADYNQKVEEGKYADVTDFHHVKLPYIVLILDELADLMITAAREVEEPIARLAQLARAIGIHLVVATQRPSVDVITGVIKANFPARIAYQVASRIDSRTILDGSGAEHLLGNGDMLYLPGGQPKPIRLQNAFISTEEVEAICEHIERQHGYTRPYMLPSLTEKKSKGGAVVSEERDELFEEAARLIVRHQQGSVSLLQRRLKVGYSRAARIVDELEMAGIVGPFDGSKARAVLLESEAELEAYL